LRSRRATAIVGRVRDERIHRKRLVIGDAFGQVLLACHAGGGIPGVAFEVVERSDGQTVDERSIRYGPATTGTTFPVEALAGSGVINGLPVACEAPEWALRWHRGYLLRPVDRLDMARLCERFGFDLPREYL
jgi:hypothetical protein